MRFGATVGARAAGAGGGLGLWGEGDLAEGWAHASLPRGRCTHSARAGGVRGRGVRATDRKGPGLSRT